MEREESFTQVITITSPLCIEFFNFFSRKSDDAKIQNKLNTKAMDT